MARWIVLSIFSFTLFACEENILEFSADKKSQNALVFQMQEHINKFEYDLALDVFATMTSAQQSSRPARELYASAYMGKCGLDVLGFVDNVSNGTGNLLLILLQAMTDTTSTMANDCRLAENIIDANIANLTTKTVDYDMALLNGLGKTGAILNLNGADANNVLDNNFDPCDTGHLSDTDATQIVTALTRVFSYLDDTSLNFFGATLDGQCDSGDPLEVAGLCSPVNTVDVSASQICAVRALINESDTLGLGTCTGGIGACACGSCPL